VDSIIGAFSSFGPSADGRIKPEVCAVGVKTTLVRSSDGSIIRSNGTSYATPLLAGLAASLWSALPDENAMQIRKRIISSADRYDNPDENKYGYGIPDAWKAYKMGDEQSTELVQNMEIEQPSKIIRGEQILIFRHGHIYNLAGQRIE
jgi:subtilisin family serine protease